MEQLLKKTVTAVFYIFSIITSLLFIFPDESSQENMLLSLTAVSISGILVIFPYLHNIKIKRPCIALSIIACLAAAVRITWVTLVQVIPMTDFLTYHTLAQNIMYNRAIPNSVFVSLFPHVFGFSKVLSFFYTIFGPETTTAVYMNIVLNIGILLMIYFLGKNLFNVNTGLVAAAIYAFWPSQIFFNTFVLTEPLYTFGMLLLTCFYFVIINRVNKTIYIILSFLVLGAAVGFLKFIRPAASILLLSILIHYFFISKNRDDKVKTCFYRTGYKFALSLAFVLSCNYIIGASIKSIEQTIGINIARHTPGFYIFIGTNLEGKGKYNSEDAAVLQTMISKGIPADKIQRQLSESGLKRFLKTDIRSQIKHQMFKNKCMWRIDSDSINFTRGTISPTSRINIEKHSIWLSDAANFYYSVFFFIALSSLFIFKEKIPSFCFVFYLYILGTVAAHMLVEVQSRYHYPVIPLFCILAASVLVRKSTTCED